MFGLEIGTLSFEYSVDGGIQWNQLWSRTGNQGPEWRKTYLSLSAIPNQAIVQFRFVGEGGDGAKGDIALDNLAFFGSEDLGIPQNQYFVE